MTTKYLYLTLLFFGIIVFGNAQNSVSKIDSLEKWLTKYPKKDTIWVKNALELEREYYFNQSSKVGIYTSEIIRTSLNLNFFYGITKGYKELANQQIAKGKYKEAINTVFEKLKYLEKYPDAIEMGNSYSILGRIYSLSEKKDQESIKYYTLAVKQVEKLPLLNTKRSRLLAGHTANLATAYVAMQNYEKALIILMDALKIAQSIKNKDKEYYYLLFTIYQNIGNAHNELGHFTQSNQFLQRGLDILEKYKINNGLTNLYAVFCNNYIELGQFDKANQKLQVLKDKKDANELNAEDTRLYLKVLVDVKEKQKDFEKAFFALKEGVKLNDTLKTIEQQKEIRELFVKYETEQKEQQIKQLKNEQELVDTRNKYLIVVAALLLLLLIGAFIAIMQVQKAKKKTDVANDLRDKLFSIIAHDLRTPAANLQKITSTIKYVFSKKDDAMIADLSTTIQDSATSLSGLVDNLLHWSLLQQGKVAIHPEKFVLLYEVKELMDTLRSRAATKNIQLVFDETSLVEVFADRMMVQIIVRNLLDNAIKFTREGKKISAEIVSDNQNAELRIIDEGIGISESVRAVLFENNASQKGRKGTHGEKGTGMGLYLCHELAVMNRGDVYLAETHENVGSIFVLKLPI